MKKFMVVILVALAAGCYYDNEERLYPDLGKGCDTVNVTYSKTIAPIFQTYCLGCHGARDYATSGGNINFDDFAMVQAMATDGMIMGSITHTPPHPFMPKDREKLDTCSISKIKIWIDAGAIGN